MFTRNEMSLANATSRSGGAIGRNAIVPTFVRPLIGHQTLVLDYGAGKDAIHTKAFRKDGYMGVVAYEFGENDSDYHDSNALSHTYPIVYASNVLNVQSSHKMMLKTIREISAATSQAAYVNYPMDPRKSDMVRAEVQTMLEDYFDVVIRVGGTPNAPLWECLK